MRTKEELYRAAQQRVATRRQRAVTLADEVHGRALAAIPQLAQAEGDVSRFGAQAALLAAKGASPALRQEALNQSEAARQSCRDLLCAAGYAPESLLPQYSCPHCRDTGVLNGHTCPCVFETMRALRREEINTASPLALCSFDSFLLEKYPDAVDPELGGSLRVYMGKLTEYCRQYAGQFSLKNPSLLFAGNAGLGKTHLALAVADTVLSSGFDVIYASAGSLVNKLDSEHFSSGGTPWMDAAQEADLLILDDLGTEFITPFVVSALYELVNARMLCHRPTIYTTNIVAAPAFEARYTEKVASRILGGSKIFKFFGQDLRVHR